MNNVIAWMNFILLVMTLGRKLANLAVDIYLEIEKKVEKKKETGLPAPNSDEKANLFDSTFRAKAVDVAGVIPPNERIDKAREGAWKTQAENIGKIPKPLSANRRDQTAKV